MDRRTYTVRFTRTEYTWMQQHLTGQVTWNGKYRANPWSAKEMSSAASKLKKACPGFGWPGQTAVLDGHDAGSHLEIEFGYGNDSYLILAIREGSGAVVSSSRVNRARR